MLSLSTQSLHIVLVPASYFPRIGGLETAARNLAREFVAAGHRVTIITNRYPRTLKAYEEIDRIPVYRILFCGLGLPAGSLKSIIKDLALLLWLPISLTQWFFLLDMTSSFLSLQAFLPIFRNGCDLGFRG